MLMALVCTFQEGRPSVCTTYSRAASLHLQHNIQEANINLGEGLPVAVPKVFFLFEQSVGLRSDQVS